jgi:ribosomal protein S18 acetylase RimI-like enzyme
MEIQLFSIENEQAVITLWQKCGFVQPWNNPHLDIQRKLMGGYEGHRGWVNYLAVDPAFRKKGFGRQLMAEIEKRLLALGCPKINLQVRMDNTSALEFYSQIGYKDDNVVSLGKRLIVDSEKHE